MAMSIMHIRSSKRLADEEADLAEQEAIRALLLEDERARSGAGVSPRVFYHRTCISRCPDLCADACQHVC